MKNLQVQINSKSNLKPYDYLEMHCYVDFYKGWWWCGVVLKEILVQKILYLQVVIKKKLQYNLLLGNNLAMNCNTSANTKKLHNQGLKELQLLQLTLSPL